MSAIFSVNSHMNNCSRAVTFFERNSQPIHKLSISGSHCFSINFGNNAVTADFFNIPDSAPVNFFAVGTLKAQTDRMGRSTFRKCGIFQKLCIFHRVVVNAADFKDTARQCSCFIKDNIFGLRQCFHIV